MEPTPTQLLASLLFALAIGHTFASGLFERLAHRHPRHAGLWHLLGEVEVVFGFWAMVLVGALFLMEGSAAAIEYVEGRDFTEPMFVFAVMVIAGARPVLQVAGWLVQRVAGLLPLAPLSALYFTVLALVPLLGSLITEPAAMTLAALMLSREVLAVPRSNALRYGTLGVLFVNVSVGGTLTHFAAPPVLMVAETWQWNTPFMLANFGWKAGLAVLVNAALATLLFRRELAATAPRAAREEARAPAAIVFLHLLLLAGVVAFAHHPPFFMGLLLFFMGVAAAYPRHQGRLLLRESLLVAFFLAGLVILGGQQAWWLQPLLQGMSSDVVFFGALALTAVTDNAALTYLGSLVEGLSDGFKYALVAGAVAGGGLTVIANAPNPAGLAMLRRHFDEGAVNLFWLLVAALPPTLVAVLALRLL